MEGKTESKAIPCEQALKKNAVSCSVHLAAEKERSLCQEMEPAPF